MDYTDRLRAFPLLSGIGGEDLSVLSGLLKEKRTTAGENIITEGEQGDEVYVLLEGMVDIIKTTIYGDRFVVATLNADAHCVFGEMAMIDSDKRSATVQAKTDCLTLSITRADFDRFCDEHPKSGVVLLKMISTNLVRNIRMENNNLRLVYQALIEEIETE